MRQSKEDTAIGEILRKAGINDLKITEEQKRAFEEAVKQAIEEWLKNKSTLRRLGGGLILSEGLGPY